MTPVHEELLKTARELVEQIEHDDVGMMVGGQWMGGNGGLLSRDTIKLSYALRKELARVEQ